MVKKIFIVLIAALAIAFLVYFVFFRAGDEQKIKQLINEFCVDAAKNKEASSAAALLIKTNILQKYFTDPCNLTVHRGFLRGTYSDVRAANEIMRVNMLLQDSDLSVSDIMVALDGDEASAVFTGRFRGTLKSGDRVDEVREVELKLKKIDKKWKISAAEVHKILEK